MQDPALLEAALEGLELQRQRIEQQISQVRGLLRRSSAGKKRAPGKATAKRSTIKRVLSPAARKRIAAAQKRRWAEFRKDQSAKEA